ncbi:MAG: hypothetical protein ACYC9Y_15325 [Candidatus Methylomirabilia bacterium]
MTIPGNPKQFARDIAEGFFVFNQATCRQFTPAELRSIYRLLEQVSREIRGEQLPLEDVVLIQKKNMRLSRANNSLLFIRNHAKRHGIVL